MANTCIVPERMNGSATSSVSAVRQPKVIAQSRRNSSSSTGSPRPSVPCAQVRKRSGSGGFSGASASGTSRQSRVPWH